MASVAGGRDLEERFAASSGRLGALCDLVAAALPLPGDAVVALCVLDQDGACLHAVAASSGAGARIPRRDAGPLALGRSPVGLALTTRQVEQVTVDLDGLLIGDDSDRSTAFRSGKTAMCTAPLLVLGEPIGVLACTIADEAQRDLVAEALSAVATTSALWIDRARHQLWLQRRLESEAAIVQLGERALAGDIAGFQRHAVRLLATVARADIVSIAEAEPGGRQLRRVAQFGIPSHVPSAVPIEEAVAAGLLADTAQYAVVEWYQDDDASAATGLVADLGIAARVTVAIRRDGELLALVSIARTSRTTFSQTSRRFLVVVAQILAGALEQRATNARLVAQAMTDPLTKLANRTQLADRVAQCVVDPERRGQSTALILFDLDEFKVVNDSLGHAMGDAVLRSVAARLVGTARPVDLVARLGGDEFAIFCADVDEQSAVAVATRLLRALAAPVVVGGTSLVVRASVGVALCEAADRGFPSGPFEPILQRADLAMYRAKATGGNGVVVFDTVLAEEMQRRHEIEQGLREAFATDGQLSVVYQPIVEVATGMVRGVEALARWTHPVLGSVAPNDFVPVAEKSGMIRELDAWVLRTVARQAAAWAAVPLPPSGVRVGVNVSAKELGDPSYVADVADTLLAAGCRPELLTVELTETAVADAAGTRALHALADLGVKVVLDDFGTGYSSLGELRRLPVQLMKVDRGFVSGLGANEADDLIVRSTIALAHSLGMTVIAEGVETCEQLELLRAYGCDAVQGYLLARPMAAAAMTELLVADGRWPELLGVRSAAASMPGDARNVSFD